MKQNKTKQKNNGLFNKVRQNDFRGNSRSYGIIPGYSQGVRKPINTVSIIKETIQYGNLSVKAHGTAYCKPCVFYYQT